MSANATQGNFALDYIAEPRLRMPGAGLPMIAMIVVLLVALFAPGSVAGVAQEGDIGAILFGP